MKAIFLALALGIFLNMSSIGGTVWPIGSVAAVVIMGIYLKVNQDRRFDEIMNYLKERDRAGAAPEPAEEDTTDRSGVRDGGD